MSAARRSPRRPTLASVARQAQKAGIDVERFEVEAEKIVIITRCGDSVSVEPTNPWDEVLNEDGDHAPKQKRSA
jgi:hypothetical protein